MRVSMTFISGSRWEGKIRKAFQGICRPRSRRGGATRASGAPPDCAGAAIGVCSWPRGQRNPFQESRASVSTNRDEATAARSSTTAVWGIQRGGERVQFQLALDASDFTEKAILDNYNARSFYESDVSMLMINVLRSGDVVFDVGANCGYFSVLAASLVGPRGRVVAM